jgi:transcriptional regulator with GAF, ATPase, and Fis domain
MSAPRNQQVLHPAGVQVTAQVDPETAESRLRAIQSITDAALSGLDDRELLAELLDRVRGILQADTAAVLLLDISSGQLIATAAAGLEEEVRQGVRIPVGRGFAGHIAAKHQPVVLRRRDAGAGGQRADPRRHRPADVPAPGRSARDPHRRTGEKQ